MGRLSAVEFDIINARVNAAVSYRSLRNVSLGFLYLVLEQFFPNRISELSSLITDGANDQGVDAIEVIENDEVAEVLIFQSKYRDTQQNTDKTINENEVLKISKFLSDLFEKSEWMSNSCNLPLREIVQRIWKLHELGFLCRYRVIFCSNDQGLSSSARTILQGRFFSENAISYEHYGSKDLLRDLGLGKKETEVGNLQVIGREAFERTDGDIRGVIASVDARSFVDLIQTDDGQSVKRHLFDDNLRVFLGENGGYNADIIATATSRDSHLFWYLNNGITITCCNYSYNKGHSNPIIRIENFQIVNGAQTSHSLLAAKKENAESVENVVVTVRVYATNRSDIAERVAVATNSQARIQSRDLKANHEILKKLELAFHSRGYYFERKRNMHHDQDAKKRIDALKLGQILMSYYLREPDRARTESDSIFDNQFQRIFHEQYDIDELCSLFDLYSRIEELKDEYQSKFSNNIEAGGDHHYLVYGHWFVLYVIRLLVSKTGKPIPKRGEADQIILEAISIIAKACSQNKMVAHYQMFRSPKTKERILAELGEKQMSLFDLLA